VIEPLRISFEVRCAVDHAFETWTEATSTWWPPGHSVSGEPDIDVVFEGQPGGRIFERTRDGREIDWGEITAWEPPHRLAYLWHIRRDRRDATDVIVTFVEVGDEATRVEIVHGGWDRLGGDGASWREANQGGWDGLLPHFRAAVERRG
jgi:uncharacterized protein YndB with AHSA1/START domain